MTRYQLRVRDYLKKCIDRKAMVADVLHVCTIPQLERLERDGYVTIDGNRMGDLVHWVAGVR